MEEGHEYKAKDFKRFVKDMEKAGLEVTHYRRGWFWEGPAAICENIQDVLSNTKVKCQWDNMGLGYIVYPVAREEK